MLGQKEIVWQDGRLQWNMFDRPVMSGTRMPPVANLIDELPIGEVACDVREAAMHLALTQHAKDGH
jgi:hypothetical protein